MNIRIPACLFAVSVLATPLAAADNLHLSYEIRTPKIAKLDGDAQLEFVTEQSIRGTTLDLAHQYEEDGFVVYSETCLLSPDDVRRAVVFRPVGSAPEQVFVLSNSRVRKPAGWSTWQRPTYVEKSDATWNFMHDVKKHERSTVIPPDCLEMRYRISGQAGRNDQEYIQGTWKVVSTERNGMPWREIVGNVATFKAGRLTTTDDKVGKAFRLNAATNPKLIDFLRTGDGEPQVTAIGIYFLEEDSLEICFTLPEYQRPRIFKTSKTGDKAVLLVYLVDQQ